MTEALVNVESFLVRRFLVGASGKNLNNIFGQLVTALLDGEEPIVRDDPHTALRRTQVLGQ